MAILAGALFFASVPISYAQFHTICTGADCYFWQLSPRDVAALQGLHLSVDFYAGYSIALRVLYAVGFCTLGVALFLTRPANWVALYASMAFVLTGVSGSEVVAEAYPSWNLPVAFVGFLGEVFFFILFYIFPDGRFVPRWTRVPAIILIAYEALHYFLPAWAPSGYRWADSLIWLMLGLAVILLAQIYRYIHVSGPVERQQTKWVVWGLAVASLGIVAALFPRFVFPSLVQSGAVGVLYALVGFTVYVVAILLIPLSIGIAILRYRLWDIDVIINRTLVYAVLTASLALVYFGGVALLEGLLRALTGQESQLAHSQLAIVASTLAVAGLFGPLRRRVQGFIDRRFYRGKYDAARTLEAFGARARDEVDLERLTGELLTVVDRTVQPAHVSLWLRQPQHQNARNMKAVPLYPERDRG